MCQANQSVLLCQIDRFLVSKKRSFTKLSSLVGQNLGSLYGQHWVDPMGIDNIFHEFLLCRCNLQLGFCIFMGMVGHKKHNRLFRERLKWGLVILFSSLCLLLFSPMSKEKTIAYYFTHPFALFHSEPTNPLQRIIDKVIPEDIFDQFDQLNYL
jgi:hypothetical protein